MVYALKTHLSTDRARSGLVSFNATNAANHYATPPVTPSHLESKKQDSKLLPITSPNVNRLSSKFAAKSYLNILPLYTLPYEISLFQKSPYSRSNWSKQPCKIYPRKKTVLKHFSGKIFILYFNSLTKRRSHQPLKSPLSTVHNCCNKETDVAGKCRTCLAVVTDDISLSVSKSKLV